MPKQTKPSLLLLNLRLKTNIDREAAIEATEQFCLDMQSELAAYKRFKSYDQNQSDFHDFC